MKSSPPALLAQHSSQLCYNVAFSVAPFIWRYQSKLQTHANNRPFFEYLWGKKLLWRPIYWWENWIRNLLNWVRNWLEVTDVGLNPQTPGSQPRALLTDNMWTSQQRSPIQLSGFAHDANTTTGRLDEGITPTPQYNSLYYTATLITTKWCH